MTEWQRITWTFLHTITLNYNDQYKQEYLNFFDTLKTIIPCKICRNHYIQNITNNNVKCDKIFNWTVDLHNTVNKMHNKRMWSYDEAKKYYQNYGFNNQLLKQFIFEYSKTNFMKGNEKTIQFIKMINTLPYVYPNNEKRIKLIKFKDRFGLNRKNIKKWLYAFLLICNH